MPVKVTSKITSRANSNANAYKIMTGFPLTIRKQPSGESFWIHVESNYRVSTCKQKIQRMRGIPRENIRLAIPKGSKAIENDNGNDSLTYDFDQRTLKSLGFVGSFSDSDSEANGPTLEIAPITIYVQTPTGRRIKLKDTVEVEAMVDILEEMVTAELESAHLLEASDSSKERFRLYHDRIPLRRGTPITKYKVKHMDILKLKFGTDEADANQKEERKKAFRKTEAHQNKQERNIIKSMRKSESADNLKRLVRGNSSNSIRNNKPKQQRSSSSSPIRGASRPTTRSSRETRTPPSPRKRLSNRTYSANEIIQKQSPRRKNVRKSSSDNLYEQLSQSMTDIQSSPASPLEPATRRKLKDLRASDTVILANTRPRSGSAGSKTNKNPEKIHDEAVPGRRRINIKKMTNEEGRRSRSKSITESRRKKSRSRSRAKSDNNQTQDSTRRRKKNDEEKTVERRRRSNSATSEKRAQVEKIERSKRSRSRGREKNSKTQDTRSSSNKSEAKVETALSRNYSGTRKSSRGRRTRNRSKSIEESKKRTEEGHPRKVRAKNDGIPDVFAISKHKATKASDGDKEECNSPSSPTSVVVETLEISRKMDDDSSQGSSDIQSHETDIDVYSTSSESEAFEPRDKTEESTSKIPDKITDNSNEATSDNKMLASLRQRKEKKQKSITPETKNANKSKRLSLKELKQAKSKEQPTEAKEKNNASATKAIRISSKPRRKSWRDLGEEFDKNTTKTGTIASKPKELPETSKSFIESISFRTTITSSSSTESTASAPVENTSPRNEKSILAVTENKTKEKIEDEIIEDFTKMVAGLSDTHPPVRRSIVDRVKAKFERGSSVNSAAEPKNELSRHHKEKKHPKSHVTVATNPKAKVTKGSSSEIAANEFETERALTETISAVRLSILEKSTAKREVSADKVVEATAGISIRPLRPSLKDTPLWNSSNGLSIARSASEAIAKLESSVTREIEKEETLTSKESEVKSATTIKSVKPQAKPIQTAVEMVEKPLQPSSRVISAFGSPNSAKTCIKDRIGKFQTGSTIEKSPASVKDRIGKSPRCIKDRIGKFQSGETENTNVKSPELFKDRIGIIQMGGKENESAKSPEPAKERVGKIQMGGKENESAKPRGFIKDRIRKIQMGGKENESAKSPERVGEIQTGGKKNDSAKLRGSIKDRIGNIQLGGKDNESVKSPKRVGKIQTSGKENVSAKARGSMKENESAKSRGSIKDRIGKFQTGENENANSSGFQMIGLATLGLVSKKAVTGSAERKDDDSESTTYSFFCSNDDDSEHESDDFSDSDDESEDFSSVGDSFESIHVIGPDLIPFEITLDSDSEKLGNIKQAVAEAAGIPIAELRLGLHSDESDDEESLDDDFKLSPGDILAVQPSTVVVKMPDGRSKLELSVFPGTLLSDIKDYIAESTGTTPSRQLLFNFEKNFNEELEDDSPIARDCILRLTVY